MMRWPSWRVASRLSSATSCCSRSLICSSGCRALPSAPAPAPNRPATPRLPVRRPAAACRNRTRRGRAREIGQPPAERIEADQLGIERADARRDGVDLAVDLAARSLQVRLLLRDGAREARCSASAPSRKRPSTGRREDRGDHQDRRQQRARTRQVDLSVRPRGPVTIRRFMPRRPSGRECQWRKRHDRRAELRSAALRHVTDSARLWPNTSRWQTKQRLSIVSLIMSDPLKPLFGAWRRASTPSPARRRRHSR